MPDIQPRRSVLYVPADKPRAIAKARTLPVDALIFDLEDSVAPEAKHGRARGLAGGAEGALRLRRGGAHQRPRHGMGDRGHPRRDRLARRSHPRSEGGGTRRYRSRRSRARTGRRARCGGHLGDDRNPEGVAASWRHRRVRRRSEAAARMPGHRNQRPRARHAHARFAGPRRLRPLVRADRRRLRAPTAST